MIIEREREREIKQIFPFPMSLKTNIQKPVKKSNARSISKNIDKYHYLCSSHLKLISRRVWKYIGFVSKKMQ